MTKATPSPKPNSESTNSKETAKTSTRSSGPSRGSRGAPYPKSSTLCSPEPKSASSLLGGENRRLLRLNGTERIRIKTIHGGFEFAERRFLLPDGSSCRYLKRTGQEPVGVEVREFCLYFCNRLSFAEVAKLLERVSGERLLCERTLWNWAQGKAREIGAALRAEVDSARSLPAPAIDEAVDIYDEGAEEVLVMSDAIQVKAQKPTVSAPMMNVVVGGQKRRRRLRSG
jgi:hypothetical protein